MATQHEQALVSISIDALADAVVQRIAPLLQAHRDERTRALSKADAAAYIGRTPKAIERMLQQGKLRPVRMNDARVMVDKRQLDALIDGLPGPVDFN